MLLLSAPPPFDGGGVQQLFQRTMADGSPTSTGAVHNSVTFNLNNREVKTVTQLKYQES